MITVEALAIHPVKSARAVAVTQAMVTPRGLEHDRAFMVVDGQGDFVSAREHPELARLGAVIEGDALRLIGDGGYDVRVALACEGERRRVRVWSDEVVAIDCGPEAAGLVSTQIGAMARLVRLPEEARRPVDPSYGEAGDVVSFADGFPLLLCSTASLDAVFRPLGMASDTRRFRPNLVARAADPFCEDAWSRIVVGEVPFDVVKPCSRCTMVDVDPDEGRNDGRVLASLVPTRKIKNKVLFGQNAIPRGGGVVRVGDEIRVLG